MSVLETWACQLTPGLTQRLMLIGDRQAVVTQAAVKRRSRQVEQNASCHLVNEVDDCLE